MDDKVLKSASALLQLFGQIIVVFSRVLTDFVFKSLLNLFFIFSRSGKSVKTNKESNCTLLYFV